MKFKINIIIYIFMITLLSCSAGLAQYPPSFKWKTLRHPFFTIYYPEGHVDFAVKIYGYADDVYSKVTKELGIKPSLCSIVINPGTDLFNGYFSPFPNRISLFEVPAYSLKELDGASDFVHMTFVHEFTHYVHITAKLGWYGDLTTVLGDGLAISNSVSPGWLIEGLSTNMETILTDGGRGRNPYFKGRMLSYLDSGNMWGINSAGISSDNRPPSGRIYFSGYFMVDFLRRKYGESSISNLIKYQAEHPLGGTKEALSHITGKDYKTFYREYLDDLKIQNSEWKKRVYSDDFNLKTKFFFIENNNEADSFFWADDDNIVVLFKSYDEKKSFAKIDLGSGEIVDRFYTGNLFPLSEVKYNPYLKKAVLGSVFMHRFGGLDLAESDLVQYDFSTGKTSRLTRGKHLFAGAFNPSGRKIAAVKRRGSISSLVILDALSLSVEKEILFEDELVESPVWSPDGKSILCSLKSGGRGDIAVISVETGMAEFPLGRRDLFNDQDPSFFNDGRFVVFSSDRTGVWNIFAYNLAEKRLYQVTNSLYGATLPLSSPDGRKIAFLTMKNGLNRLSIGDFDPSLWREIKLGDGDKVKMRDFESSAAMGKVFVPHSQGIPPQPKSIPIDAYKPFIHIPYISSDEKGNSIGVFLMGRDPVSINSYSGSFFYGLDSNRPGYNMLFTNKSFWPSLNLNLYDTSEELDHVKGYSLWQRKQGGKAYLGLTTYLETTPSEIISDLNIGVEYKKFTGLNDLFIDPSNNEAFSFFSSMTLTRIPDHAKRDLVPGFGETVFLSAEKSNHELDGYNFVGMVKQFSPSIFKHHGFEFIFAGQKQDGDLSYSREYTLPRGYDSDEGFEYSYNGLFSAEYHFPIKYMDSGVGLYLLHFDLLKGSFFADFGSAWENGTPYSHWNDNIKSSFGATITTKAVLLSRLPFDGGISLGYKKDEGEGFVNFLFRFLF